MRLNFVLALCCSAIAAMLVFAAPSVAAGVSDVEAALANVVTLQRPGQDGFATIWDGNKYVQCRWLPERTFRCEAAGSLMQPSLGRILLPQRVTRLTELGWTLDTSFGNYVQTFPAGHSASQVAQKILATLREGYDADTAGLEIRTDWIASTLCPPRNGPSQNLAGMINDHPAMSRTAIYGCSYRPEDAAAAGRPLNSAGDVIDLYGQRLSGEIQRLRINVGRRVIVQVETGAGYVQCAPEAAARAIYCEAQSGETWAVLARLLTPERIQRLRDVGFADPGRAPNYSKTYPLDRFTDADIASELLTILYDVYGYNGKPGLMFATEKGR